MKKGKRKREVEIPVERRGKTQGIPWVGPECETGWGGEKYGVLKTEVPLGGSQHTAEVSTFRRSSVRSKTRARA